MSRTDRVAEDSDRSSSEVVKGGSQRLSWGVGSADFDGRRDLLSGWTSGKRSVGILSLGRHGGRPSPLTEAVEAFLSAAMSGGSSLEVLELTG
jgi:hypothetical protein